MKDLINKIKKFLTKHVDKLLHYLVCFFIVTICFPINIWVGLGLAGVCAVGKEIYDYYDYGLFSWWDLLFDVLGMGSAFGIYLLL